MCKNKMSNNKMNHAKMCNTKMCNNKMGIMSLLREAVISFKLFGKRINMFKPRCVQ